MIQRPSPAYFLEPCFLALLATSIGLSGCAKRDAGAESEVSTETASDSTWLSTELEARTQYSRTPIAVSGRLLDKDGNPLSQAGIQAAGVQASTDGNGRFLLPGLSRQNAMLEVNKAGYRTERIPIWLAQGLDVEQVVMLPIILTRAEATRMVFGGDVQLGRSFLDPEGKTPLNEVPKDDPNALIRVSDPLRGSQRLFEFIRPQLTEADFGAANLETVVTDAPDTPAPERSFAFFTLPGSLPALKWAGLDYVSLANNHIYDYLDQGVSDTLRHLREHDIRYSGAGGNIEEAFRPYRQEIGGRLYSLLSLVSVEGVTVPNTTAARPERGGAADLNANERIAAVLRSEREAGATPIAMIHAGHEYTEAPPPGGYTIGRLEYVAQAGARLVVAHHPHVPQGFSWHNGVLMAHSLGNLVFDQDRLETLMGLVLEVNWSNGALESARGSGTYIDGFIPRPLAGFWQDAFLRRLANSSAPWAGAVVPYPGGAWLSPDYNQFVAQDRTIEVSAEVDSRGFAVVDLRPHLDFGESVYRVRAGQPVRARLGRDILLFGDMEDMDVDGEELEASRFWVSGFEQHVSSFVCRHKPHRGSQALCLVRKSSNKGPSSINFRNRVRVLGDRINSPQKDLTLLAYLSAQNAGAVEVEVTYHASAGDKEFGSEKPITVSAGSYDWKLFATDLNMPPDDPNVPLDPDNPFSKDIGDASARSLRIFGYHNPPAEGEGIARVDDMAVVSWQDTLELDSQSEIRVPHAKDFIRVEGAPGKVDLTVTLRRYLPRISAGP